MSDLPGHDHDPDPAALDELRRAFAVDDPPPPAAPDRRDRHTGASSGESEGAGHAPDASDGPGAGDAGDAPDVGDAGDAPDDVDTDDADAADVDTDRADAADVDTDDVDTDDEDGGEPVGVVAAIDDGDADPSTAITEPTPVQRRHEPVPLDDGPEPTPPSLADADPDATPEADVHPDRVHPDHVDPDHVHPDHVRPDRVAVDPLIAAQATPGPTSGGDDEPDRSPIDPLVVGPATPAPTPEGDDSSPRIIRIDDYAGSSEVARPEPDSPPPGTESVTADEGGDGGVISISDDDLPDAVYVEGNLDSEGGGTIVFIENDESGDTLAPESERDMRRGIEPRMRERRVAVKRAQGRRRLKRVAIVVGIVVIIVGVLAVLGSGLFAVRADDVRVTGVAYSQGERFDEIIDDAVGTPVLRVDTTTIEDELEAIPWVDDAEVRTDFPHGLIIDIRERAAISTYQGPDGRFRVLDREGRVLDVLDLYPYAYVLIGGPDAVDLEPGEFAPQGYAAASELAKNLTSSVRGRVTMIEVLADGSRLTLNLDDGSTVYFGEARDLLAKLVRLEAVLSNGCDGPPGLIDVSTADTTRPDANLDCSTSP